MKNRAQNARKTRVPGPVPADTTLYKLIELIAEEVVVAERKGGPAPPKGAGTDTRTSKPDKR